MSGVCHIPVPSALDPAALAELRRTLATEAQLVVLRGGDDLFCMGLAPGLEGDPAAALSDFVDILAALVEGPFMTVAVVTGAAQGGGLGIAAACDVVLATPSARVALPEVLWGLAPATIAPVLLRRVRPAALRLMMLDGEARDANAAQALGLVDRVVAPEKLERALARTVRMLGRGSPGAVAEARRLTSPPGLRTAMEAGARRTAAALRSGEARARLAALAEGDAPWL